VTEIVRHPLRIFEDICLARPIPREIRSDPLINPLISVI